MSVLSRAKGLVSKQVKAALGQAGYEVSTAFWPTLSSDLQSSINKVRRYTMTSERGMAALSDAIDYLEARQLEGDFVECGVWRGGSSMMMAERLKLHGNTARNIYLYDTFEGMSEPTEHDVHLHSGKSAAERLASASTTEAVWALAPLDEVKSNLGSTGYPSEKIHFVQGKVEETIPQTMPDKIALLRLDTDWYESTKHELEHLYPRLVPGGVLLIDDYGHWAGSQKAVDAYFADAPLLLGRVDHTVRMAIKV